jgi:hypothetical protein
MDLWTEDPRIVSPRMAVTGRVARTGQRPKR